MEVVDTSETELNTDFVKFLDGVFLGQEWIALDGLIDQVLKDETLEPVMAGDSRNEASCVHVFRFMVRDGNRSSIVNEHASKKLLNIFERANFIEKLRNEVSLDNLELQRIQYNRMAEGDYISVHTDSESNPSYKASVVIRTKSDYSGGELVIYKNGEKLVVDQPEHSAILMDPRNEHEVLPVQSGVRNSICVFLG